MMDPADRVEKSFTDRVLTLGSGLGYVVGNRFPNSDPVFSTRRQPCW